jgi:hypothetical protein
MSWLDYFRLRLYRRVHRIHQEEHAGCIRRCERCQTFHIWTGSTGAQFHYSEMDARYLGNVISLLERRALRDARYIEGVDDENGNEQDPFEPILDIARPKHLLCMKTEMLRKLKEAE